MTSQSSQRAPAPSSAVRPTSPAPLQNVKLPAAFVELVRLEAGQPVLEDLEQVPDFIANNRTWDALREHLKEVRVICWGDSLAVFRLLLKDNTHLVFKGCPPECAERDREQLAAEKAVATSFPLHPLMTTVIAASDEQSGICSVLPYAGVSFAHIMQQPEYYEQLTMEEREQVFAVLAAHTLTVHKVLQGKGCQGFVYRDTKPDNVTYDPTTNQVKLIDFGYAVRVDDTEYLDGYTLGRFTPEMVDPADGFSSFWDPMGRYLAINKTTDVFLTGQQGLEMVTGLPQELLAPEHDLSDDDAMNAFLMAHHEANYAEVIEQVPSSEARDFLLQAMAVDPDDRLTPATALQHPFLAAPAPAVNARVADTLTAHAEQVCHILDLLAPLQDQPDVFLAVQQQQWWREQQRTTTAVVAAAEQQGDDIINSCSRTCSSSNMSIDDAGERCRCVSSDSSTAAVSVDADTTTAPDVVQHKQHRFIGKYLRKLKQKIRRRSSSSEPHYGSGGKARLCSTPLSTPAALNMLYAGQEDAAVFIEPMAVSVPGWCGIRCFWVKGSGFFSKGSSWCKKR